MLFPYPDEDDASAVAQQALRAEFDFARRMYNFWMMREKDRFINNCPFDDQILGAALMLNTQACREFRTATELCLRCEAYTASIVARTLFETALATAFVLLPEIRVRVIQEGPAKWRAVVPHKYRRKRDILPREFRASLYNENMFLERNVFASKCANKRGRKQYARSKVSDRKALAAIESEIGKEWTYILSHNPHSYSGLSVSNLATVVKNRMDHWYDTVYFYQSRISHATAGSHHLQKYGDELGPQWLSPIQMISGTMQTACAMFLICLSVLTDEIDFGVATASAFAAFRREHATLFK